jgi:release factor glutamine methyltransferase
MRKVIDRTQHKLYRSLLETLTESWQGLQDKPEETPEGTLNALWYLAAGKPKPIEQCDGNRLPILSKTDHIILIKLIEERLSGTPLAYQTGRQLFMGIEMIVSPEALIPRKETELLGYAALKKLKELLDERGSATAIDVCTGCGNIALALKYYERRADVFGSDISHEAIKLANRNAESLGLADQIVFCKSDLLNAFNNHQFLEKTDLITCNPPYIPSSSLTKLNPEIADYEPSLAFDGGPFGVSILLRIIKEAPRFLKPNSWLCVEVGLGQDQAIINRIEKSKLYQDVVKVHDSNGNVRSLLACTLG